MAQVNQETAPGGCSYNLESVQNRELSIPKMEAMQTPKKLHHQFTTQHGTGWKTPTPFIKTTVLQDTIEFH